MYLYNLKIDGGVKALPPLFSAGPEDVAAMRKERDALTLGARPLFDNQPAHWPVHWPAPNRAYWRSSGAAAVLRASDSSLLINLSANRARKSVIEQEYVAATIKVNPMADSILADVGSRNLWSTIAPSVHSPITGSDVDRLLFVQSGRHVEGVVARLAAIAVEHSLCPFRTRVRVRNAAACYWCTTKYRHDNIVHSIQDANALSFWAAPAAIGDELEFNAVVWCGDAKAARGMALLSRLADAGGPFHNETAYLLREFEAGRVLMVGTTNLARALPSVEASDLWDAIDEALFILKTYNHVPEDMFAHYVSFFIHNLPVVDLAHWREHGPLTWVPTRSTHDAPALAGARAEQLHALAREHLGDNTLRHLGAENHDEEVALASAAFSHLARGELYAPQNLIDSLAPATEHVVAPVVATFLGAMMVQYAHPLDQQAVYYAEVDPAQPGVVADYPLAPTVANFQDVWSCVSGRSLWRLFAYSPGPAAGEVDPALVDGFAWASPDEHLALTRLAPVPAGDGRWMLFTGVHGADRVACPINLRAYALRQWLPSIARFPGNLALPDARLRRFDLEAGTRLGFAAQRVPLGWGNGGVRVQRFLEEVDADVGTIRFLLPDGMRDLPVDHDRRQMSVLYVHALASVWECAHFQSTLSDAFGRWMRAQHANDRLTVPASEAVLYLGGLQMQRKIPPCGGLWPLCYVKQSEVRTDALRRDPIVRALQDPNLLAAAALKLRAVVDACLLLIRASNARVVGCMTPLPMDDTLLARMERVRHVDLAQHDPPTLLSLMRWYAHGVFDSQHFGRLLSLGAEPRGGMRYREPVICAALDQDRVMHMNWVIPQLTPSSAISMWLGVAPPGLYLDAKGRAALLSAKRGEHWHDLSDGFRANLFLHREDEANAAVIVNQFGEERQLASIYFRLYGRSYECGVASLARAHLSDSSPLELRLVPPVEHSARRWVIPGANPIAQRPHLPCAPRVRQNANNATVVQAYAHGILDLNVTAAGGIDRAMLLDTIESEWCTDGLSLGVLNPTRCQDTREYKTVGPLFTVYQPEPPVQVAAVVSPVCVRLLGAFGGTGASGNSDLPTHVVGATPATAFTSQVLRSAASVGDPPGPRVAETVDPRASMDFNAAAAQFDNATKSALMELILSGADDLQTVISKITVNTSSTTPSTRTP